MSNPFSLESFLSHLLVIFLLLVVTACSDRNIKTILKVQGSTMGTQYHISIVILNGQPLINTDDSKKEIDTVLFEINKQMSTYIPDSEISQFNHFINDGWFSVSKDFAFVVSAAQKVSKETQGAFDITLAPLIDLWGFGKKNQFEMPTKQQIEKAKKNIGYQFLNVRQSPPALKKDNKYLRIDLSAIAKGFAVDKIAEHLIKQGYSDFIVEIGGEIRSQGFNQFNKPWQVGIEVPVYNDRKVSDKLIISNTALATSGDYRNFFIKNGHRYSHTINPITGKPTTHRLASITVLHKFAMLADAYATAFMVMGELKGKAFAEKNNIKVNMKIRKNDAFITWQNIDQIKIEQSAQKCQIVGGCVYLD